MAHLNKWIFTIIVPLALSLAAVFLHAPILYVILFLSHFLLLAFVPIFKGRENLWMFIMVTISSIPVNVLLLVILSDFTYLAFYPFILLKALQAILYYIILFSLEQIIMGVITRLIWRKQLKNNL